MARVTRRRRSVSPRRPAGRRIDPSAPWKHGELPVIGLVGGIGAGKSRVAECLQQHGAFLVDADRVGHALLDQTPSRERVIERFGREILGAPAETDCPAPIHRRALGARVFADPAARRDLESILHPRMRQTFLKAIRRTQRQGRYSAIVLDAAVLFEAGWNDLCDLVIFVDAPRDVRLARLESSRGWTASDLEAREAAQWPLDRKRQLADEILANDGTTDALDQAVGRLWNRRFSSRPHPTPRRTAPR